MPRINKTKKTSRSLTKDHRKRHGNHHNKKTNYIKVYAPYLPLVLSIIASSFLSFWQPVHTETLAYATNVNSSGLLSSTNSQRKDNGKNALTLNTKLSNAAQSKANDMVARNYWSHVTPTGEQPWFFINNAGYTYTKAGENLAYGFATSNDTVIGWMNSPTHKANLLDEVFTEVGFGFANSQDFNNDGNQTVVVAMYGQPKALNSVAANNKVNGQSSTQSSIAQKPATPSDSIAQSTMDKTQPQTKTSPSATSKAKKSVKTKKELPSPITTGSKLSIPPTSQNIAKAQTITSGHTPWILGTTIFITFVFLIIILTKHGLKARHLIKDLVHGTEKFVLHNPLIDSILLGIIIFGVALSRTVGTIL